MKTIKLSHVLFSIAVVTALVLAAIPAAPVYALSSSATQTSLAATDNVSPTLTASVIVCRSVVRWYHGHRIVVRVCHRVHRPDTQ